MSFASLSFTSLSTRIINFTTDISNRYLEGNYNGFHHESWFKLYIESENPLLENCVRCLAFSVRNKLSLTSWKWTLSELTFECFWLVKLIKTNKIEFVLRICWLWILLWVQVGANNKNPMYHMARNWNPSFFILKLIIIFW